MIRGDATACIAELSKLQDRLARLSQVPGKTAVLAAPEMTKEVKKEFQQGTDPQGRPWAPLRPGTRKQHGPPPLTATHGLADSEKTEVQGLRIKISFAKPYGRFHQTGYRHGSRFVPARKFVPGMAASPAYKRIFLAASRKAALAAMEGR